MTRKDNHDDAQSQRFKEAARDLCADESEERFNAALSKIARQKPKANEGSEPPSDRGSLTRPETGANDGEDDA